MTAGGRGRRVLSGLALAALLIAATAAGLARALALRAAWRRDGAALALPRPGVLRALSFGHPRLVADLLTARANVLFGAGLADGADPAALESYLDSAVALDPTVRDRYLRGAAMLIYARPVITAEAVLAADRLLARGTGALPDDWELWFQLGFNQLFELPHLAATDDARRTGWRAGGVAALARAARLTGAPPWLAALVAQLLAAGGDVGAARAYLGDAAARSEDPETRALLRRQLDALRRHAEVDRPSQVGKGSAP
jgi:hypothetical protein